MAINKRKVLDAARKYAQKGAKQKALKEYNKLVQADPRDAKLLLEVGDSYRRWGQAEEAIDEAIRTGATAGVRLQISHLSVVARLVQDGSRAVT